MPQIGATGSWTIHMPTINQNTSMIKNLPQEYSSTTNSSNSNGTTNGLNGYPSSQASTYRISGSPTIVNISLKRFPGDSIGLSIVAAQVCFFFCYTKKKEKKLKKKVGIVWVFKFIFPKKVSKKMSIFLREFEKFENFSEIKSKNFFFENIQKIITFSKFLTKFLLL